MKLKVNIYYFTSYKKKVLLLVQLIFEPLNVALKHVHVFSQIKSM